MRTARIAIISTFVSAVSLILLVVQLRTTNSVHGETNPAQTIVIDYPRKGSIFPPDFAPPTLRWRDSSPISRKWIIEFEFHDGRSPLTFNAKGPHPKVGAIDSRCISETNKLPELTPEQAASHVWQPDAAAWEQIKRRSTARKTDVTVRGLETGADGQTVSEGSTQFEVSTDPVGAPIFYRDVPLMPAATEKGVIKPLAPAAIPLIQWCLRSVASTESRVVLEGMHTCANCHSFSADGKTLGIDMDGPQNDKGLYAVVSIKPTTVVRTQDMVSWNPTHDRQFAFNRVGFMSQVSPNGKYVLTMLTASGRAPENNYYVANFKDYHFLQVFYPTRGILFWYDRATGRRHPLPGADDPDYVQTNGVWSPDGEYVVFARAKAVDPYPPGSKLATHANDPNEAPIQYDLYRVPFNGGEGGKAEPIAGASDNGMSNSFPKVSPDGRWIVFVRAHNGEVMRPDGELFIVPAHGGTAKRLNANMSPMNSWHSWSPNSRWLVFSSKADGPYTKMYLTHIDKNGNDSPPILIEDATAANRAVNLPEFVNISPEGLTKIETPAVDMYRQFDHAADLSEQGRDAEALVEWNALAASNPDDARILNNLGTTLTRLGKLDQAVKDFRRALQVDPEYHLVHTNLASALMNAGRAAESLPEFQLALQSYPDSAELHVNYGEALQTAGHEDLSIPEFERAIELDPKLARAHNDLGLAWISSGNEALRPEAKIQLQTAIELDPKSADAKNNLGTLYGIEGDDRKAEQMFREALTCDPRSAKVMINLAATLASESRFADAEQFLKAALEIDPGNQQARQLMAMVESASRQ